MAPDDDLFRQAMEGDGVAALDDDDTKGHRVPLRHRTRKPTQAAEGSFEPVRFQIEMIGDRIEGRGPGVGWEPLKRLRRGKFAIEAMIDLHGLSEADAHFLVREELALARKAGHRCLVINHGKGLHSEGPAVLKAKVPEWLAEPPHGRWIVAFSTVPSNSGNLVVLLRKRKTS